MIKLLIIRDNKHIYNDDTIHGRPVWNYNYYLLSERKQLHLNKPFIVYTSIRADRRFHCSVINLNFSNNHIGTKQSYAKCKKRSHSYLFVSATRYTWNIDKPTVLMIKVTKLKYLGSVVNDDILPGIRNGVNVAREQWLKPKLHITVLSSAMERSNGQRHRMECVCRRSSVVTDRGEHGRDEAKLRFGSLVRSTTDSIATDCDLVER